MTTQGTAGEEDPEGVDRLGRLYDWTAEERDHVAALVAQARDTFAAARSEQDRLAEWVLANCPGEPSQDGGVVDTVIRLIGSARADGDRANGATELRVDLELLEFVGCQFWACEGPDVPPQDMATCKVCGRIRELRSLLGGSS